MTAKSVNPDSNSQVLSLQPKGGKHYTHMEKFGISAKQQKINRIVTALFNELTFQNADFDKQDKKHKEYCETFSVKFAPMQRIYKLNRQKLTEIIQDALGFVDRRVVYAMIHYLVGTGFIAHNPTSQIQHTGIGQKPIIMPTNDTKYELNSDIILQKYIDNQKGNNVHPPVTLDKFNAVSGIGASSSTKGANPSHIDKNGIQGLNSQNQNEGN